MDQLWSPWRLEYVTGAKQQGCIFCLDGASDREALVLFRGALAYVVLNLYPYNNGHVMVVPYRHVGSLAALTPEELSEVGLLTQRCEIAVNEAYRPQGINVGINLGEPAGAGVLDHVHVHLVPRWMGDTNFMTVVGEVRVIPEDLNATAGKLRPILATLAR